VAAYAPLKVLKGFRFMLSSTWKSGLRYTPFIQTGIEPNGRPRYELQQDKPFSKIGSPWFWTDLKVTRDVAFGAKRNRRSVSLSFEVTNLTNFKSATIINGVTGTAYRDGDPLPTGTRDPKYPDPRDSGLPPNNPARFLAPRQIWFGAQFNL
jgi:hypothetical protein